MITMIKKYFVLLVQFILLLQFVSNANDIINEINNIICI